MTRTTDKRDADVPVMTTLHKQERVTDDLFLLSHSWQNQSYQQVMPLDRSCGALRAARRRPTRRRQRGESPGNSSLARFRCCAFFRAPKGHQQISPGHRPGVHRRVGLVGDVADAWGHHASALRRHNSQNPSAYPGSSGTRRLYRPLEDEYHQSETYRAPGRGGRGRCDVLPRLVGISRSCNRPRRGIEA